MSILLLGIFHIYALVTYVFPIWLYLILTNRSGDIEQNAELQRKNQYFQ